MSRSDEKNFTCESCGRPIRHQGFCLGCNIRRKKERENMTEEATPKATIRTKPNLTFPHPTIRASQDELINDIRYALQDRKHLIADAPTGLGKTIAALFPAIEYAKNNDKTVFFLTSRHSQHKMAVETLQSIGGISAVDIVGKKWLCSHDVQDMDSSMFSNFCYAMLKDNMCKYYKNFRKKGNITSEAENMILKLGKNPHHSEDAKKLASSRFCTFEVLMEMAKSSDVVVGDYYHIFSANGEKFFKRMSKALDNSVIIVDEAHNLPARIRKNLSSKISTRTIDLAKKENQKFGLGVGKYINYVEDAIGSVARQKLLTKNESFIEKHELVSAIEKFCSLKELVVLFTAAGEKVFENDRSKSFIDKLASFLASWAGDDYGYARIICREKILDKDHVSVYYNCMDPSFVSKSVISESYSTILMSGTLSPMQMYRDLLGMEEARTIMKTYASPFPKENRLNIIAKGITTRYKERNPETYARIARTVALCTTNIRNNVAVFFPSYEIMKKIRAILDGKLEKQMFMELQGMTKEERKVLQDEFALNHRKGAVLFGVLAGSFSEGIDLPGDRLNGVVVVGLPLEKPTMMVKALIDYYQQRFGKGREYGYVYPAMIKVMQAAGRCIRTENDVGVCVFGDERFSWGSYKSIFPETWDFTVTERPELEIRKFFQGNA